MCCAGVRRRLRLSHFEFIDAAQELAAGCVTRLAELGDYEYNWSAGEQQSCSRPCGSRHKRCWTS